MDIICFPENDLMYNVLITDDKEVFRRKIKRMQYFRDNSDRFSLAFEAPNGLESLEILRQNRVDIVLTDIRMPFVNGIDLLKQINAEGLCKCVILLSEFAEFSYAKAGILNGAFDYILKPVDEEKIREAFDRAYNYLETIGERTREDEPGILAGLILENDRMNIMSYSGHLFSGISRKNPSVARQRLALEELYRDTADRLLSRRPYLQLYIPFDSFFSPESFQTGDELADAFTRSMLCLADAADALNVSSKNETVAAACGRILANPGAELDFSGLAESLFTNAKYLSRLMKQETGKSAVQYITFLRTERAKLLLRDPNAKIYQIALDLGFSDTDYFSKVFKKITGQSPTDYREECGL